MKYYYIIHGFMGSNIENWFPWFKEQIDSEKQLCVVPQFPVEIKKHNYIEWKKMLDLYNYEYKMMDNQSVIIGHSTGSICALKYILETKTHIDKLILVSGFNNFFAEDISDVHNKVNPTYYVEDTDLSKIKKYVNGVICIYGNDDPYIPQEVFHDLAVKTNAKEVIVNNGGHLNKQSGYTSFEEILKHI